MRTCALLAMLLGACASDSDPDVHIERQSATVASANAASWAEGGAVLVGVPGTFSFPQPLSLRISVVDSNKLDENGIPAQLRPSAPPCSSSPRTTAHSRPVTPRPSRRSRSLPM